MIRTRMTLINKLGLHARAAAKFVSTATAFDSSVRVGSGGRMVDGKSIMQIMMLAASKGTELDFEFDGPEEREAEQALRALIEDYFGEGE